MEQKKEVVNGPMLVAKCRRYEEQFNVPELEWLKSESWLASFCKAHKIKEHRRHGEASSVDEKAVHDERERVQEILKQYDLKDIFNFDETGLFAL
jgi:hypothetical protein